MIGRLLGRAPKPAAAASAAVPAKAAGGGVMRATNAMFDRARAMAPRVFNRSSDFVPVQERRAARPVEALDPRMKMPLTASLGPSANATFSRAVVGLARHAVRNNAHMKRGLRMVVSNISGTGPLPCSRFPELQDVIRAWLPSADARGRMSWGHLCRTILLMDRIDGEAFIRLRPRYLTDGHVLPLQLELIETEQVAHDWTMIGGNGNRIVTGIEIDRLDRPVAYWMFPVHPLDGLMQSVTGGVGVPAPVPATSVLHVFSSVRGNSWRGDSSLMPALVRLYNLSSYEFAEQTRKNVSTLFAGYITREAGQEGTPLVGEESVDYNDAISQLALEPGLLAELPAGTKIEWSEPPDTGSSYEPYVRFALQYLAACCDASYEDFANDWRGANDRTWRAAQVAMRQFADEERDRLERQFLNPLYKQLVDLAIATGQWSPPAGVKPWEIYQVRWSWPGAKNPNQYQEFNALLLAIQAGLMSRDAAIEEMGGDPVEIDRRNGEGKKRAEGFGLQYSAYMPPATPGAGAAAQTVGGMFEGLIQGIVRAQVEEGLRQRLADVGGTEEEVEPPSAPDPKQPEPPPGKGRPGKDAPPSKGPAKPAPKPDPTDPTG